MSSSERRLSGVLSKDAPSSELKVDARVEVQGKSGTVRFVGTTSFQTGKWVGIELDTPNGKNSGVVQGKRYFECRTNHGVFVRPSQVKPLSAEVWILHCICAALVLCMSVPLSTQCLSTVSLLLFPLGWFIKPFSYISDRESLASCRDNSWEHSCFVS